MIRQIFDRIMNEYPPYDVKEVFQFEGNELANYIRQEIPIQFRNQFNQFPTLIWRASAGKGQWADAPWIATLDPLVTETPQEGYYPVYLFTRSLDAVYLSLNQGMTGLRQEWGHTEAKEILMHRAGILRGRLAAELKPRFKTDPIDLQAGSSNSRLAFYEPGHAFGIRYDRINLPPDDKLSEDLLEMLRLYHLAVIRGGTEEFDLGKPVVDPIRPDLSDLTLEEKRRYRYHRTIERNSKLAEKAKQIHGYTCQVCGFNFEQRYGLLGRDYIEAHHRIPVSKLPLDQNIRLSPKDDFAVVCANCHRMIHRSGAPETFDEFLKVFQSI